MKLKALVDGVMRIFAILSVLGFFWITLVVGIIANDAGQSSGGRVGSFIMFVGGALGLWVLICSVSHRQMIDLLRRRPALQFLAVKLPIYIFGLSGLIWLTLNLFGSFSGALRPRDKINPSSAEYPAENLHPAHLVSLTGTLPSMIPLKDFDAIYETKVGLTPASTDRCQMPGEISPNQPRPLVARVPIPIVRSADRYAATVAVDHFIAGDCQWHLAQVQYRLYVTGFEYSEPNVGSANIAVPGDADAADAAKGHSLYTGPLHIWCRKNNPNSGITPFYPEGCGIFENFFPPSIAQRHTSVPLDQQDAHTVVFVLPDTKSVELDFHDVSALTVEQ